MKEINKLIKIINSPVPASILGTAIVMFLQWIYNKRVNPMNSFSFFNILIIAFLSVISSYVIYTYYFQIQREKKIDHYIANTYIHFADLSSNSPYRSFLYKQLALAKYIEIKDYQIVRQLLNEIISLLKEIKKDELKTEDRIRMNEIFSYLDKNKYDLEIKQINEIIKRIT